MRDKISSCNVSSVNYPTSDEQQQQQQRQQRRQQRQIEEYFDCPLSPPFLPATASPGGATWRRPNEVRSVGKMTFSCFKPLLDKVGWILSGPIFSFYPPAIPAKLERRATPENVSLLADTVNQGEDRIG